MAEVKQYEGNDRLTELAGNTQAAFERYEEEKRVNNRKIFELGLKIESLEEENAALKNKIKGLNMQIGRLNANKDD